MKPGLFDFDKGYMYKEKRSESAGYLCSSFPILSASLALYYDAFWSFLVQSKGLFTNYVDKILTFFDHLPPCVDIFYCIMLTKSGHFRTTYLLLLVNVVCERPLMLYHFYVSCLKSGQDKKEIFDWNSDQWSGSNKELN